MVREGKQKESQGGIEDREMAIFLERNDIRIYVGHALVFGFCSNKYVTYRTVLRALTCGVLQFCYPSYRLALLPYDPSNPLLSPECEGCVNFEQGEHGNADIMPAGCYEVIDEHKKIRLERSNFLLVQTPVRTRSHVTPKTPTETKKAVRMMGTKEIESIRDSASDHRDQRASNRDQGIPSEAQNRARASDAPARTWDVHGKCAFTSAGPVLSIDPKQPSNVQIMHIWQHSYLDLWKEAELEQYCTDPGPETMARPFEHRYFGFHKICSLSNMCAARSDIHNLLDETELSIDSTSRHLVSFSKNLAHYTEYQYDVRHITRIYRPAEQFWDLHFMNSVRAHCVCPSIHVGMETLQQTHEEGGEEERVEQNKVLIEEPGQSRTRSMPSGSGSNIMRMHEGREGQADSTSAATSYAPANLSSPLSSGNNTNRMYEAHEGLADSTSATAPSCALSDVSSTETSPSISSMSSSSSRELYSNISKRVGTLAKDFWGTGALQGTASDDEDGGRVVLTSDGFWASKRRRDAHDTAMQHFDEESGVFHLETGAGKDAMEDYIARSLSNPRPGPLYPSRIANLDDMDFA